VSPAKGTRVLGYVRASTEEQQATLEAQREKITRYCELYGLQLVDVIVDSGASARSLDREGLQRALGHLEAGEVDGLVVAKLDRLTRSVRDLGTLIDLVQEGSWSLYSVADHIDTTTAAGRLVLNIMGSVTQWEREEISERTKAALAVKKAQGVKLGRRFEQLAPGVLERVRALRAEGLTLEAVAAACQEEGLPTPKGGKAWHPTTVRRLLERVGTLTVGEVGTATAGVVGTVTAGQTVTARVGHDDSPYAQQWRKRRDQT
jgi:DNA invertase Pin-like site-specific DNA recombinase